jgi:hypothetical protein
MRSRTLVACGLAALTSAALTACSPSGPSTKEEVCSTFDALGKQLVDGNGIIGNPLFHKAEDLANVAGRYDGSPSLATDASALHKIAKSDSTNSAQLMNATTHVASLCGHRLGTNAIFGN